jgi:hypothetical protein
VKSTLQFYQPLFLGIAHSPEIKQVQLTAPEQEGFPQQRFPDVPVNLLKVYFGKVDTTPSIEALVRKAVDWYNQNVETIPPLERDNRKNHRLHLRMTGEVLGLLPSAHSALEAYRQYVATFNALETKVAPGKKDYRMYCHDKVPKIGPNYYLVRHYGFYILVFAPNGAIESFRRNTPTVVDMDGKNRPDMALRMQFFNATGSDFDRLQKLLQANNQQPTGIPTFLADTLVYTRQVFKAGANGQDAWGQTYPLSQEAYRRKKTFTSGLRETKA